MSYHFTETMASSSSKLPAFESHGGRLAAFDDGHIPETFRFQQRDKTRGKNNDDDHDEEEEALATPRIVTYDLPQQVETLHASSECRPSSTVHIYDNVLKPNNAHMLYMVTASSSQTDDESSTKENNDRCIPSIKLEGESPWGTYVTIKEALEWIEWNKQREENEVVVYDNTTNNFEEYLGAWSQTMIQFYNWQRRNRVVQQTSEEKKEEQLESDNRKRQSYVGDMDNVRHALARQAVAKFFIETIPSQSGTTEVVQAPSDTQSNETLYQSAQILKQAHGVAVWALSSNPGHSVQYHIDYAELLRYEYNVTVPPLWAGTVQCSSLWNEQKSPNASQSICNLNQGQSEQNHNMKGGEFCANLRGLQHYSEHGYKGNLSGDAMGGWKRPDTSETNNILKGGVHNNESNQWVTIPYAFNRGIVHRGDLPHLSAPVESIDSPHLSRVIVGFNVFGHDVGENIAKAPEHSRPFRRKVRLYRSTIKSSANVSKKGGMDLSQIRKNKGLTKLLVLAKREKIKEELRQNQERLSEQIWCKMLSSHGKEPKRRVSDLVNEFGSSNDDVDGAWPKSVDVEIHLGNILGRKKGTTEMEKGRSCWQNHFQDRDGVVGPSGVWYCIKMLPEGSLFSLSAGLGIVKYTE